ncbi:hypothetical protein [Streptosporangium sp. NPDC006930]|uniref:hypothetical protein n=1 Tax=unclassified Streptosporangium TaxID=2632669 RepID=UPI0034309B2E
MWVDRNFALDYTLKSLEKVLDGEPRREVRAARVVIKDAAYAVFTRMLDLIDEHSGPVQLRQLIIRLDAMLDEQVEVLRSRMAATVPGVVAALPSQAADRLVHEHSRWAATTGWTLINAADPCGT